MKRLIIIAGALAMACAPAIAATTTPKHHHKAHRGYATRPVARPVPSDYGATALHRIPSMDPPFCDSPNVVTVESCRISSNGKR
jgi:hypothetical protein